ncbi:phosphate ABC transporter permease PstA [Sulfurospirillum multivorans]|uniref:Phosphate transport system permease protein PstA n=2 Tax=Sulfurospirillum multivorans TaxID=66821 RepID=A0AA86AQF9_SULMK|nr:phosphate ABC transporter permease PstA [Sulfurospirillum multivorans]AHJ13826.1 phosphate transport system permease protein PstA [Sulfurospirillum multivorans DSM 12446]QEH07316.1 phosphate transport system permease protein PstA [Sulfurospirillum multivorans]
MKEQNDNYFYIPQIKRRNQKAALFKGATIMAIVFSVSFLIFFLVDLGRSGYPAFFQTYVKMEVTINEEVLENPYVAVKGKNLKIISRAWLRDIPNQVKQNPTWMNTTQEHWVLANSEVDQYVKGKESRTKPNERAYVDELKEKGLVELKFNTIFLTTGDSKIPENSGIYSSIIGTVMTIIVTMLIAFPIGVMTAIYLEEFAPDNRWTQIIEVNINNLAAIPSILFGLLGLAIFINFFGVPRSSPLVGGMTLALMCLPVIIVSSKASLKSVPASIRQAGFGLGLTKWQIVRDHVLPLAMPGIMTGSIISIAHALGETAPLIIVGMIAFVPDAATSFTDAATVLPAQIFTWAGMPEKAYLERTAAGIIVLLAVLLSMNAGAVYLRKKFERKW